MRNEVAVLVTQYNDGSGIKSARKTVFVEKKSVGREEFYKAYASGLKPKFVFSIDAEDYRCCTKKVNGKKYYPTHVIYDSEELEIIRDFKKEYDGEVEVTVK